MVANRVYEGSPLVKRRGRSESREREKPQKNGNFLCHFEEKLAQFPSIEPLIGSARLFRKSNSIPEDDEQQRAKRNLANDKSVVVKLRSIK